MTGHPAPFSLPRHPGRPTYALLGLLTLAVTAALVGCGTTTDKSVSNPDRTRVVAGARKVTSLRAPVQATSAESKLIKVGPAGSKTYGWNRLVGPSKTNRGPMEMEMLGNVNYVNGNGRFFGFITLTNPGGDLLSMSMNGVAKVLPDGVTTLNAELTIIGGTGDYIEANGKGTMTGTRQAVVGAPIDIVLDLGLIGVSG